MVPNPSRSGICGVLVAAVTFSLLTSEPVRGQEIAPPAPVNYLFPDGPPDATTYDSKVLSLKVGIAAIVDYTLVSQDASSEAQVGAQENIGDLRAGRLVFAGQFKFKRPWTFLVAGDFNEFRQPEDRMFEGLDIALTVPMWKKARITIGKQKEPFVYEMVGDAANLPHHERLLSPFFVSRNIGIRYSDNYLDDRMSLGVGIYNDWFQHDLSLAESGTQVSGRLTGLPLMSTDGREFLHLGVAVRHVGADSGELRYKGRPESNVLDNYVDTDLFAARHAEQLGLEALYNTGPFSILGEYATAWVDAPENGDPRFSGAYVTGSYVLTGETRPYDRTVGYARRIIPRSRWGAVELAGRFGLVDTDDTHVKGGTLAKWFAGVNWWASRQWKLSLGYGLADLDKLNSTGRTHTLLTRLQWIY